MPAEWQPSPAGAPAQVFALLPLCQPVSATPAPPLTSTGPMWPACKRFAAAGAGTPCAAAAAAAAGRRSAQRRSSSRRAARLPVVATSEFWWEDEQEFDGEKHSTCTGRLRCRPRTQLTPAPAGRLRIVTPPPSTTPPTALTEVLLPKRAVIATPDACTCQLQQLQQLRFAAAFTAPGLQQQAEQLWEALGRAGPPLFLKVRARDALSQLEQQQVNRGAWHAVPGRRRSLVHKNRRCLHLQPVPCVTSR